MLYKEALEIAYYELEKDKDLKEKSIRTLLRQEETLKGYAKIYEKRAKLLKGDPVSYRTAIFKIISLYEYASVIAKRIEEKDPEYLNSQEILEDLGSVEEGYLTQINAPNIRKTSQEFIAKCQEQLRQIRTKAHSQLEQHDEILEKNQETNEKEVSELLEKKSQQKNLSQEEQELFKRYERLQLEEKQLKEQNVTIQKIYQEVAKGLRSLVKDLIEDCIEVLGKAPCDYAYVGLGSLAREEATPGSGPPLSRGCRGCEPSPRRRGPASRWRPGRTSCEARRWRPADPGMRVGPPGCSRGGRR